MQQGGIERRRGRRIPLEAPLLIRRIGTREPEVFQEHTTKNIGLTGVYFETAADEATVAMNEMVVTSVSIPESHRRDFPFTRLAGSSRVARVSDLPDRGSDGQKRIGIALEFGNDLTALTAIPAHG